MRCRSYWYHLVGNIYTYCLAPRINIGEMSFEFIQIHSAAVEINMFGTGAFHFTVYGTCYHIARSEVGTSVTCRASPSTVERANAVLKFARSYESVFSVKREPLR